MAPLLSDRDLLARLIGFDTVSSRPNAEAVDWIADYLDRPGLRVRRQEGPEAGKANLVVVAGGERGGADDGGGRARAGGGRAEGAAEGREEGLTLCGHLDVVPADEPEWVSDPFELVERNGRLFGRGAADMKGFCALAINRLAARADAPLARPLALLLTFDEEVGCLGARHFAERWPADRRLPRSVLVGEPTGLRAVRMHKGHRKLGIVIRGTPAHSGSPHLGVNAVERAGAVLQALAELRRRMEAERSPHARHFPSVPYSVLAVTGIRGGEAENVIPARCEIDVGLRVMPGADPAREAERVRRAVAGAPATRESGEPAGASVEVRTVTENPPLLTRADVPLHRALAELLGQEESLGVGFASDAGWLSAGGYECVLWGPGSIEVAHRPNEHLPATEFERAGRRLGELVERMCGAS